MDFKGIYMAFIGISLGCYKDFIWIYMDFMVISMDNWDNNCDNNWDIMARTLQFMGMIKLLYNWVNFGVFDGDVVFAVRYPLVLTESRSFFPCMVSKVDMTKHHLNRCI